MTDIESELARLESLDKEAGQPPWAEVATTTANRHYACGSAPWLLTGDDDPRILADAALIAAARNALPALLREVRMLREALEASRGFELVATRDRLLRADRKLGEK